MLDEAPTLRLADVGFEFATPPRDRGVSGRMTRRRSESRLCEGTLLAGRYRVLHRTKIGWVAYDERLARPVAIEALTGAGAPSELIRREAANDERLCDAVVFENEAFAIRTMTVL